MKVSSEQGRSEIEFETDIKEIEICNQDKNVHSQKIQAKVSAEFHNLTTEVSQTPTSYPVSLKDRLQNKTQRCPETRSVTNEKFQKTLELWTHIKP